MISLVLDAGPLGPNGLGIVAVNDLMHYSWDESTLSGLDIAMALEAFTQNQWQRWESYDNYSVSRIVDLWKFD